MTLSSEPRKKGRRVLRWLKWTGIVVLALFALLMFEREKNRRQEVRDRSPAVVIGKTWTREAVLLELRVVEREGWSLPDSAEAIRTENRALHTERVVVGVDTVTRERTLPGYRFSRGRLRRDGNRVDTVAEEVTTYRDSSVYAPWYVYRVREWIPVDTLRDAYDGKGPPRAPAWPAPPPGSKGRIEPGSQWYEVLFRVAGQPDQTKSISGEDEWNQYQVGQRWAYGWSAFYPRDSLRACILWHRGRGEAPPDTLGCSPRKRRR